MLASTKQTIDHSPMARHPQDGPTSTLNILQLAALVVLVCIILAALLLAALFVRFAPITGGQAPKALKKGEAVRACPQSPHIVVDTLNLTHWLRGSGPGRGREPTGEEPRAKAAGAAKTKPRPLELVDIIAAIDQTAAPLRAQFPGKVMYVVKDRESQINTPEVRAAYKSAADRNQVWIYDVEQYSEPPLKSEVPFISPQDPRAVEYEHAARARDDLYMAILAQKHRCAVLTEDRFRDFSAFRANVAPFRVFGYTYWRDTPEEEFIRPAAYVYSRLPKPRALRYAAVLAKGVKGALVGMPTPPPWAETERTGGRSSAPAFRRTPGSSVAPSLGALDDF